MLASPSSRGRVSRLLSLSLPLSLFLSPSLPLSPCAVCCVCVCVSGWWPSPVTADRGRPTVSSEERFNSLNPLHYTRVAKYNQPRRDLLQRALRVVRSEGGGGCFLNKRLPKKPNLKECQYKLARSQATAVPVRNVLVQRLTLTRGHHACVRYSSVTPRRCYVTTLTASARTGCLQTERRSR